MLIKDFSCETLKGKKRQIPLNTQSLWVLLSWRLPSTWNVPWILISLWVQSLGFICWHCSSGSLWRATQGVAGMAEVSWYGLQILWTWWPLQGSLGRMDGYGSLCIKKTLRRVHKSLGDKHKWSLQAREEQHVWHGPWDQCDKAISPIADRGSNEMAPLKPTWLGEVVHLLTLQLSTPLADSYLRSPSLQSERRPQTFSVPPLGPSSRRAPPESSDTPTMYQGHAEHWSFPSVPRFWERQMCKQCRRSARWGVW